MPRKENPYRQILRRDYPEPLIALLAFILGLWLWNHYTAEPAGYAPGTEAMALVKIDRDLRLAETMSGDPAWLRWFAGAATPDEVRTRARKALEKLDDAGALSAAGFEAYAILVAADAGEPAHAVLSRAMPGRPPPDFGDWSGALASGTGTWWQAAWVVSVSGMHPPVQPWQTVFNDGSIRLRNRAIAARSAVWLVALAGVGFIPRAAMMLVRALFSKHRGYAAAWSPQLGLFVFLAAVLAWIGFALALELGLAAVPDMHPGLVTLLDAGARLLPALIAIGLLFRCPGHAARVTGLFGDVPVRAVLGLFAMLVLFDLPLRWATGQHEIVDPAAGISAHEAGLWGLVFTVVGACLVAPVSEEILYRGVLFRALANQLGVATGAVLSSAVFAALHFYGLYGLLSVAAFGFSCALLYAATRSLAAVIVLHILYNSAIKLPEWLFYQAPLG